MARLDTNRCVWIAFLALVSCATAPRSASPRTRDRATDDANEIVVMPTSGGGPSQASLVTVNAIPFAELKRCATRILELKQARTVLGSEGTLIERERVRIGGNADSLERERTRVDPNKRAAVEALNHKIERQQEDHRKFNDTVAAYNGRVENERLISGAFDAACAGRTYRRVDVERLSAEQRAALEQSSSESKIPLRVP